MKNELNLSKVGEMSYLLELQVKQKDDDMTITETKYVRNLLKKCELAATHLKIFKDQASIDIVQTLYRNMIGNLFYLTTTRPDIANSVGVCARTMLIHIRHHFFRKILEKKMIALKHVTTYRKLAIIFTKSLDNTELETLRSSSGLCDMFS
ncbi:unnamed protein product [Rhodiola kirilowii]